MQDPAYPGTNASNDPGRDRGNDTAIGQAPPEPRRLTRDLDHRMIGGVCAGIAQRYALDPLLVRAGFVALTLVSGAGIVLYGALWLLMPPPGADATPRALLRTNLDDMADRARVTAEGVASGARHPVETTRVARTGTSRVARSVTAAAAAARETWHATAPPAPPADNTTPASPPPSEGTSSWPPAPNPAS